LWGLSQREQLWHGAQINFGDLPPYLTYGFKLPCIRFLIPLVQNHCSLLFPKSMHNKGGIADPDLESSAFWTIWIRDPDQ
jgi:hypothetical protein